MAPRVLGHTGVELNASQGRESGMALKEHGGSAERGLGTGLGHSYLGGLVQVKDPSVNLHLRVLMSF